MSVKSLTHAGCSVAPPGLRARGRRGPRAPFGRPGLRIPRSYGANIGGPEGRGCLAPGAVPARRAGTSPGSAAVPARQAPPGAPGVLEGPAGRPMRFRANSLTHGARAILMEGVVIKRLRQKTGARHECKTSYSWPALSDVEGRARRMAESGVPRLRRLQSCRGCTAADNAAVAPKLTRSGAHSLTHGARAILTEGMALKRIRRKTGARHECKISYSWGARQPSYVFEQPVRVVRGPENTKPDASSFASFAAQKPRSPMPVHSRHAASAWPPPGRRAGSRLVPAGGGPGVASGPGTG